MRARDDELAEQVDELEEEVGVGPRTADPDETDPDRSDHESVVDTRTAEDAGPGEPTD